MGKYLAHDFSSQLDCIARLRPADREFDELCSHFEEVSGLLDGDDISSPEEHEELAAVLVDLRREIADYLARHGRQAN